jgi:hypothetical protein
MFTAIDLVRCYADCGKHLGGGRRLGRALGRALALGRRPVGQFHRNAEFRIVMRPGARELAIGRRRLAARLRPFL